MSHIGYYEEFRGELRCTLCGAKARRAPNGSWRTNCETGCHPSRNVYPGPTGKLRLVQPDTADRDELRGRSSRK